MQCNESVSATIEKRFDLAARRAKRDNNNEDVAPHVTMKRASEVYDEIFNTANEDGSGDNVFVDQNNAAMNHGYSQIEDPVYRHPLYYDEY